MSFNFIPFGTLYAEPVRNGLNRPTEVRGSGYRMVNMGELFAYDRIANQDMERVRLNERELEVATLLQGDLLFARSSLKIEGTGKCSLVQTLPEITTFESHLIRVRLDISKTDSRFYFYFFQSHIGRNTVLSIAKQVGAAGLPGSKLAGLLVPLPQRETQVSIADILSAYDDLIENNRRRMALLEESARQLYQEWFVRLRFPGHEHSKIVNGVPEGWEKRSLGECFTLKRGHDLPVSVRMPGSVPVVSSSGVTGYHNEKKADGPGVVTGRYGTLGDVYFVEQDYWPHNTSLYVVDFKGNSARVVYFILTHALEKAQSNNAAVPGLNRNVIHTFTVIWPPKSLHAHFDELLKPLFQQLTIIRTMIEKLRAASDLLLPRLVSGEVVV